jgi:hypothetical protein
VYFAEEEFIFQQLKALGFTQPLTEMCTRNISGCEVLPARKADNLTAIYKTIV